MSKYHAIRTEVDGIVFDSKKEATRWSELTLLQKHGEIRNLERQVKYTITINNVLICRYYADFRYEDCKLGNEVVVEDVKGIKNGSAYSMFRIKKKLMRAVYGIEILET